MPAIQYNDLGGITGVSETTKVPSSNRSRDRNNIQRLAFECDSNNHFNGKIHVQASVGDPTRAAANTIWFDIAEMEIRDEGGTWSYEPQGEFANIRVVCKQGNYWSAAFGTDPGVVVTTGDFTINGITVSVNAGDDASTVATTINNTAGIQTDGTIFADVVGTAGLRIYKNDGADLIIADTLNTPLADMGFTAGTFTSGNISKIRMLG